MGQRNRGGKKGGVTPGWASVSELTWDQGLAIDELDRSAYDTSLSGHGRLLPQMFRSGVRSWADSNLEASVMFAPVSLAKESSGNRSTKLALRPSHSPHYFSAEPTAVSRPTLFSYNFANLRLFAPGENREFERAEPALVTLPRPMQAKLEVGALDDPLEREADQLADHAMRMPDATLGASASGGPALQRKCAHCQGEEEHKNLIRKATGRPATLDRTAAPPVVHRVLRSPGRPLDPATRAFFEPRLQANLSAVRVHSDALAANSARAVDALAYTVGHHVVLGAGASNAPNRLMAHELAHVMQQDGSLRRAATPAQMGTVTPGPKDGVGQSQEADPCAGWERDPESFSKRASEFYLRKIWQPSFRVTKIECSPPPPAWDCKVTVDTGSGLINLNVRWYTGQKGKDKGVVVTDKYPCYYQYHCEADGRLVFHERNCINEPGRVPKP